MFVKGQRWYSQGEPELGLGLVIECESKRISMSFPLSQEERIYGIMTHPLKRFKLEKGDKINHPIHQEVTIDETLETDNILTYKCGELLIPESELPAKIDLNGPLERLIVKNFDSEEFSKIRYMGYMGLRKYQEFPYKGLISPKIRLLPHQVYVVSEIIKMDSPKIMLCDEVGLGKTIQACMALNSFIQTNKVEKTLIVVPDSLVNQWFVELYTKFNLPFKTLNDSSEEELSSEDSKVIIGLGYLQRNPSLLEKLKEIGFNALILDEAHQLNLANDELPFNEAIKTINKKSFYTVLLSATPEVLGTRHLYQQLNFLDPIKYNSFEDFSKLIDTSHKVSNLITNVDLLNKRDQLAKYISTEELNSIESTNELKSILIDRFGTGRNYFRNSRKNLERYSKLFNERILHEHPLEIDGVINDKSVFAAKLGALYKVCKEAPDKKVLVICHSKTLVLKLQRCLLEFENMKLATFHSDQTIMERDRQAAYFADENGAKVLLATEVGSEGRNFEFADQLVLFDLPKLPDQLEQRIGRLDRIGQINNINIHVPYVLKTFEETIFTWYNEVLNSFKSSPPGANTFYESSHSELLSLLENQFNHEKLKAFISKKREEYLIFKEKLEQGKDLLIEHNSYNDIEARKIIEIIEGFETSNKPNSFFESVSNAIGINIEELSKETIFAKPSDNLLIPSFAGLNAEGQSLTIQREIAIKTPQVDLLNWEHPLIKSSFDLFLNSPLGNCVFVKTDALSQDLYFEFVIGLQTVDENRHESAVFLPYTPIRVLLNTKSEDKTKAITKKFIDETSVSSTDEDLSILEQIPKEFLTGLFKKAMLSANKRGKNYKEKAQTALERFFSHEIARVQGLSLKEGVKSDKISSLTQKKADLITSTSNAKLQIDSIRLILGKN